MHKRPLTRDHRPPPLSVDTEKFPNLARNPALERALRIRQALQRGRPREEAVALAEQAMGPRGKWPTARRPRNGKPPARASAATGAKRPTAATRKTGKAAAPRARR